jgi:hypothetical protein
VTTPYVNEEIEGNMHDKADAIQALYQKVGIPVIVVTNTGQYCIQVRLPEGLQPISDSLEVKTDENEKVSWLPFSFTNTSWRQWPKGDTIGSCIQRLDEVYGLKVPIIVFAYDKAARSISYRSKER